jgi:hypothetical protein
MQQSRMFSRFALEKVRGFAHCEKIALIKIGMAISCRFKFSFCNVLHRNH